MVTVHLVKNPAFIPPLPPSLPPSSSYPAALLSRGFTRPTNQEPRSQERMEARTEAGGPSTLVGGVLCDAPPSFGNTRRSFRVASDSDPMFQDSILWCDPLSILWMQSTKELRVPMLRLKSVLLLSQVEAQVHNKAALLPRVCLFIIHPNST